LWCTTTSYETAARFATYCMLSALSSTTQLPRCPAFHPPSLLVARRPLLQDAERAIHSVLPLEGGRKRLLNFVMFSGGVWWERRGSWFGHHQRARHRHSKSAVCCEKWTAHPISKKIHDDRILRRIFNPYLCVVLSTVSHAVFTYITIS